MHSVSPSCALSAATADTSESRSGVPAAEELTSFSRGEAGSSTECCAHEAGRKWDTSSRWEQTLGTRPPRHCYLASKGLSPLQQWDTNWYFQLSKKLSWHSHNIKIKHFAMNYMFLHNYVHKNVLSCWPEDLSKDFLLIEVLSTT